MTLTDILAIVSTLAAAGSALFAAIELRRSRIERGEQHRIETLQRTMDAINLLQSEVLDLFAEVRKGRIYDAANNSGRMPQAETYQHYKVLIARVNHFSVCVNEGFYDMDTVDKLIGVHLIYLYDKVLPIISRARENGGNRGLYGEFEKLVNTMKQRHPTFGASKTAEKEETDAV